jgi:hypothetical protein
MRVEPLPGQGAGASDTSELLHSLVSGEGAVDQSTREALQRLLSGEPEPQAAAKEEKTPAKPVAPDTMEARRNAALAYVRRLRISAR